MVCLDDLFVERLALALGSGGGDVFCLDARRGDMLSSRRCVESRSVDKLG